jgi:hypothetical protein
MLISASFDTDNRVNMKIMAELCILYNTAEDSGKNEM